MNKQISKVSVVLLLVLLGTLIFFNKTVSDHKDQLNTFEDKHNDVVSNYDEMILMLTDENKRLKELLKDDIYCLAQCVEAEAGYYANHSKSQKYVAQVILNRVHSENFPNTIKDVIYDSHYGIPQFSVAYNGMMNREVEEETLANVYDVVLRGTDLPDYVCYFYSTSVKDNWVNKLPIYDTVEGTVFAYSEVDINE